MNLPSGWAIDVDETQPASIYVHLESEMCVSKGTDGMWYALTVEHEPGECIGQPFDTPAQGIAYVDREYAANPRHSLEW
jgi:hypothetical protein